MASKNNKVDGSALILLGKRVGDTNFMPILCQTTLSLGRQLNTIDASSKCGKDIAIDEEDGTVNMEGFMIKANVTDVITTKDLEDLYKTQDEADYVVGVVDPTGKSGLVSYRFSGVITAKNLDMNNNEKGKSTITITTTTPVETGVILPNGMILWDSDAEATGYTFDWSMFLGALDADLPSSYQQEADLVLAPGIYKSGSIAGIDKNGKLVSFYNSRSGQATYIDKSGILKTAANNIPRIDYSKGEPWYLFEKSGSNLVINSNDLTKNFWLKSPAVTVTANAALSIDGTMNASKITIQGGQSVQIFASPIAATPGSSISVSAYIKMGTKKSGYSFKVLDADNLATVITPNTNYTSQISDTEIKRISFSFQCPAGTSNVRIYLVDETTSVGGDFEVSYVQVEPSAYPTSAILTNGAVGVRAGDSSFLTTPLQTPDLGSLFARFSAQTPMTLLMKDTENRHMVATGDGRFYLISNNVSSSPTSGIKAISLWGGSDAKVVASGGVGPSVPYATGNFVGTLSMLFGSENKVLRTMAMFSRKFDDAEALTLTK